MKTETRLQSAGLRATPKRIAIGALLFDGPDRHVTADDVAAMARKAGVRPRGLEGQETGEWVLVDFGGVVVHVMGEDQRKFYALEKLWTSLPGRE